MSAAPKCICPADGRMISSGDRVYLYEPGAETRVGNVVQRDASKVHIFRKDCPVHGYTVTIDDLPVTTE